MIAWEKKNLRINQALVTDIADEAVLCKDQTKLVIFPIKVPRESADNLCEVHGGKLALPHDAEENEKLRELTLMLWIKLKIRKIFNCSKNAVMPVLYPKRSKSEDGLA